MSLEAVETRSQTVAPLLESLGTEQFGTGLFDFVSRQINIAICTAFYFPEIGSPALVIMKGRDSTEAPVRAVTEAYLQGSFARDANFLSLADALRGRPLAARCMHRDAIIDPTYRAKFYDEVNIQEKFSFVARAGLGTIYVNMYRAVADGRFQPQELTALRNISTVCTSAVRKHLALVPPALSGVPQSRSDRLQVIHRLLMNQNSGLTPREAQICAHVVLGYSTYAIAGILGLAESTVGTFRKRAYARLGITSQNELFAICLEAFARTAHAYMH